MHRAVVSGISGHLGHELARLLAAKGVEVHGLTRQDLKANPQLPVSVRLHRVDGKTEALAGVLADARPDVVFHLASLYRREHQSSDVVPLFESNVVFGARLLDAMRVAGCTRVVAASTFFQHFETDGYRPLNLYAATKQAFEDVMVYYVDAFDFSAISLLLYEIYSEADTRPKLMQAVAKAWREGTPLSLPPDDFWMDFVHVEDVAAAFLRAAFLVEEGRGMHRYSVCSGKDVTPVELSALFERIGSRRVTINRGAFPQPARSMPRPWRGPVVPGWEPRVSLEEGVSRILARLKRG
jgi:nucleoside-diphosphate-sugar epimerase